MVNIHRTTLTYHNEHIVISIPYITEYDNSLPQKSISRITKTLNSKKRKRYLTTKFGGVDGKSICFVDGRNWKS